VPTGAGGIAAVTTWTLSTTAGPKYAHRHGRGERDQRETRDLHRDGHGRRGSEARDRDAALRDRAERRDLPAAARHPAAGRLRQSGEPERHPVTATIASGGGTLGGTVSINTNASGAALFTNLSISGTAGPHALGFSAQQYTPITSGL